MLSLQGKYEEAKLAASRQVSAETATANVDDVRRMVQPKPLALPQASSPRAAAIPLAPERGPSGEATAARPATGWITRVAEIKDGA